MSDDQFAELGNEFLDDHLRRHPEAATELGDHRFDAHLTDVSGPALAGERRALDEFARRLDALETASLRNGALTAEHRVDATILRNSIQRRIFELDELRDHTWDPLVANPGRGIYLVLAREFAPLPDRLSSIAGRLAEIPDALATARAGLGAMPKVHLETAIGQFAGTIGLVQAEIDAALAAAPQCTGTIEKVRPAALTALAGHRDWLSAQLAGTVRSANSEFADPRIGADKFARKLSLTLNAMADADAILARANADLDRVSEEIAELAAQMGGGVREVLDRLAADAPDDATILSFCRDALAAQTAFVQDQDIVTVYDDPAEVIEMPEIDRGVAVAYCDPPGSLETTPLATFLAVSPAPADWTAERVASFYREYNRHMVHNLMVHEAMPGHYLQLMHSSRFAGSRTPVRAAFWSGSFVEGWAVYAEEVMAAHDYPGMGDPRAVRMQQLKMQLRMTLNAILDAGVHAHGMTEAEAMTLMLDRAFQEEGEAAGKWRRAVLTSAQLSTYYVGYTEVADLASDLRAARPSWSERQLHDAMLAHGSPPARLLRPLLLP